MAKLSKPEATPITPKKKQVRITQSAVPLWSIKEALKIAQSLYDNYASQPTAPLLIAQSLDISPGSSNWRSLTGASAAYGLTIGAYNSDKISITDLAKKIIAPTVEGGEVLAKVEAMMKPEVLSKFFTKYNNAKLPKDTIIENVLREEFNVPKDRIQSVLQLIKDNGEFTGVFRETKTGTFILIDNPQPTEHDNNTGEVTSPSEEIPKELAEKLDIINPASHPVQSTQPIPQDKPKVFISHGKNKKIVEQLKEFGYTRVGKRGKKDKEGAFPFLSTYYTRHTWATLAAYLEIPKETIAAALGHGKKDVTDIYIFFDQNKIDEANRRVIDYLNQN